MQKISLPRRIKNLFNYFPQDLVKEAFERDPSSSKCNVKWCCEQIQAGRSKNDVFPTISLFWESKNRLKKEQRSLSYYNDAKHLEDTLKELGSSKRFMKKVHKADGAEKIYEDENSSLVAIRTHEAAILYGKNTKWCIAMAKKDYFQNYYKEGMFLIYSIKINGVVHKWAALCKYWEWNLPMDTEMTRIIPDGKKFYDKRIWTIDFYDEEDQQVSLADAIGYFQERPELNKLHQEARKYLNSEKTRQEETARREVIENEMARKFAEQNTNSV